MFGKSERKRRNPTLTLAVGALAAIGAVSIVKCGKKIAGEVGRKMKAIIRGASDECDST